MQTVSIGQDFALNHMNHDMIHEILITMIEGKSNKHDGGESN